MSLFKRKKQERQGLTEDEVMQQFRQACWDLYISNLPDPVVVNANEPRKGISIPEELRDAVPRGFSIDPETWTIYFSNDDMPKHLSEKNDLLEFAKSIFHHEETHFTQVPGDGLTEAILIDSALKGFKDPNILKDMEMARGFSYLTLNVMGDLIGDTLLAKDKYGREDFGKLTLWRKRELVQAARETPQAPSLLWQTLVSAYQKMWGEDLGLDRHVRKRDTEAEKAAQSLVDILGKDYRNRVTWENKILKFAEALEPIIRKSAQQAQSQSGKSKYARQKAGLPMPDDVKTQMGEDAAESPIDRKKQNGEKVTKGKNGKDDEKDGETIDDSVLDELYSRNKEDPGHFAGVLGALKRIEPEDAIRLMYRARAKELLMKIRKKENQRAERAPSYRTSWQIGDPIVGRGGIDILPSMMASGKPVPGLTTVRRKYEASEGYGKLKMIPDLLIVIDSSGSMGWNPWINPPDARGEFDKAILAAEGAALYALANQGKVAVINHSGQGNVTQQGFTDNIDMLEKAIMVNYHGGTVVPCQELRQMIRKTESPLLTCYMSDCALNNPKDAEEAFGTGINEHDSVAVFKISGGSCGFTNGISAKGGMVYGISKIEDLIGIVVGEVIREYDSRKIEAGKKSADIGMVTNNAD
jgi:hypothetical protein